MRKKIDLTSLSLLIVVSMEEWSHVSSARRFAEGSLDYNKEILVTFHTIILPPRAMGALYPILIFCRVESTSTHIFLYNNIHNPSVEKELVTDYLFKKYMSPFWIKFEGPSSHGVVSRETPTLTIATVAIQNLQSPDRDRIPEKESAI